MKLDYENRVNIFTDASVRIYKGTTYSCAGAIIKSKEYTNAFGKVISDTTNNRGELEGIILGIKIAKNFHNTYGTTKFNIFSDSLICINSLREWVHNWRFKDGNFYGGNGIVKNQEKLIYCMKLILDSGLDLRFYHQKGHVKQSDSSLENARNVFNKSNKQNITDINFIKEISYFNDKIDKITRNLLIEDNMNNKYSSDRTDSHNSMKKEIVENYIKLISKERYI
jgi:ribonuclease HI